MTFNNIEIPQNQVGTKTPNTQLYDGVTMAMVHDGLQRHIIIKSLETSVTLPEPDLLPGEYAHLIGGNSTSIFIANAPQHQLKKLTISGTNINPSTINLDEYNRLMDISIIGTNTTRNNFIPQAGYVNNNLIIIGGEISNTFGVTIGGEVLQDGALCYMYSEDSGATFSGPWFPFVNGSNVSLEGTVVAITQYLDNFYFQIVQDATAGNFHMGVQVVEALGADLIGDYLTGHPVLLNTATDDFYQLPFVAADKKLYFCSTARNSYYIHDIEDDTFSTNPVSTISNIQTIANDVYITLEDNCTPIIITPTALTDQESFSLFYLFDEPYFLNLKSGKILVDDDQGVGPTYQMLGGASVQSDHFLQPVEIQQVP